MDQLSPSRQPWQPDRRVHEDALNSPPQRAGYANDRKRAAPRPWQFGLSLVLASLLLAGVVVATHLSIGFLARRVGYNYQLGLSEGARENLADVKDVMSYHRRLIVRDVHTSVVSIRSFGRRGSETTGERESSGSGVIVSGDGHILTNFHVIKGSRTVRVDLVGGERYAARIVGTDEKTDLALVKIDTNLDLHPIRWGDSDSLEVGDSVIAVGNPYGLSATVTSGIVSAKGRDVNMLGRDAYENFIQTDAAINPGNSGGPLLNMEGRVVGINTAILSRSGGFQGIGLAVPSSLARHVLEELIRTGRVVRGYIGVGIQDLTPGLARSFNVEGTKGVLITQVGTYSPAAKAGLQIEDIIVSMDGKPMTTADELRNVVANVKPGRKVTFHIIRKGERKDVVVTVEEQPDDLSAAVRDMSLEEYWGMELQVLTPTMARLYRLGVQEGLLVLSVSAGGFAAESGIRQGDVVTHAGEAQVKSIKQLRDALAAMDPKVGITLKLHTQGMRRQVQLRRQ